MPEGNNVIKTAISNFIIHNDTEEFIQDVKWTVLFEEFPTIIPNIFLFRNTCGIRIFKSGSKINQYKFLRKWFHEDRISLFDAKGIYSIGDEEYFWTANTGSVINVIACMANLHGYDWEVFYMDRAGETIVFKNGDEINGL